MPLSQRKLSSKRSLLETNFIDEDKEGISLITDFDSDKSDDEFDQNKSFFFPTSWTAKVPLTCTFFELPKWLQDNKDIHKGYRLPTFSYLKCAQSLFYIHNEFFNIWSHLVGAITFVIVSFGTYSYLINHSVYSTLGWMDFTVFYCFMAGAMICLGLSSAFHTLCCHSEKVCANWNRCDYVGIVALVFGSICPLIYYGFYCNSTLKIIYFTMISVFGSATISVAVAHRFRRPEFRWFRTGLFVALGGSSIIPVLHAIIIYGIQLSYDVISLKFIICTGIFYVIGALIYGTRMPESLFPGKFDIWGSSHQIFHIFVVLAALVHWYGVVQIMLYWHDSNHDCKIRIEDMKPTSSITSFAETFIDN